MGYAVVHMMKIGKGSARGIQSHNQREKEAHKNPDIDKTRGHLNYDLLNSQRINYNKAIQDRIDLFATNTKTVRKDAVVMCNFIVTSDEKTMKAMSPKKQKEFFENSMQWFGDRYGIENIVNATVHMDETTPHLHLGVVPITNDSRLSAKTLFDRKELIALQTEFVQDVGEKYGLERGKEGSESTHLSEQRFKLEKATEKLKLVEEQSKEIITSSQIASKAIEILKKELPLLLDKKEALTGEISALQCELDGRVLTVDELHKIKPRLGFGGSLKDITIEDIENLKKTAIEYNTTKSKLNKLKHEYDNIKRLVPSLEERLGNARDKNRLNKLEEIFARAPEHIREQLLPSKVIIKKSTKNFER